MTNRTRALVARFSRLDDNLERLIEETGLADADGLTEGQLEKAFGKLRVGIRDTLSEGEHDG